MSSTCKLAVVENTPYLHDIISRALDQTFAGIAHIASASACLENISHSLYLVDLMLEDMDGLSLIEDIRLKNQHVPIVAFLTEEQSGELDIDDHSLRKMASTSGADALFTAPFNLGEITNTLLRLSQNTRPEIA